MMIYKKLFLATFLGVFVMGSPVSAFPGEDDDSFDSPEKKFKAYQVLAKGGDADAQKNIGTMYGKGEGIKRNDAKALKWFKRSAENGNEVAKFNAGVMYYNGKGVSQNYDKALKWFIMSAEQGYGNAQHKIGMMYYKGEGVDRNDAEALKWFYKAAENEHADAQSNIGKMYLQGKGVDQDDEKALYWLLKGGQRSLITHHYPSFSWKTEAFSKDLLGKTFSLDAERSPENNLDLLEKLEGEIGYYMKIFTPEHDGVSESVGERMPNLVYWQIFVDAYDSLSLINRLKTQFNKPSFLISCIDMNTRYLGKDEKTPLIRSFPIQGKNYWSMGTENIDASQKFIELMGKTFSQISCVAEVFINQDDNNKYMVAQIKNIEQHLTASQKALQEELTEGLARRNTHFLDSYSLMK